MENENLTQPPKNFEEIIKRTQDQQKMNRHGAVKYIWARVCGTSPPPAAQSIDELVETQQKIKTVSTGGQGSTFEDFTAAALNSLQMRNITRALGDGDGGGGRSNLDDKFDKVLLMRMMSPQNDGMQIMLALLPLIMGGGQTQGLEKVISEVKTMVDKTETQWKELFNDSQDRLWQREVMDDQASRDETMRAFITELSASHERVVSNLGAQLERLKPQDTNEQVKGALEVLGSYQSFLSESRKALEGFGLTPGQAAEATDAATATTAKNYLMTNLGNFLGGIGNTLLGGGGPPLPPGYGYAPQQPYYYAPPTGQIPQPTFAPQQQPPVQQPPVQQPPVQYPPMQPPPGYGGAPTPYPAVPTPPEVPTQPPPIIQGGVAGAGPPPPTFQQRPPPEG